MTTVLPTPAFLLAFAAAPTLTPRASACATPSSLPVSIIRPNLFRCCLSQFSFRRRCAAVVPHFLAVDDGHSGDEIERNEDSAENDGGKKMSADDDDGDGDSSRWIKESASLDLPFSAQTAFDAFCNLPRQPSWSKWLKSVDYLRNDEKDYEIAKKQTISTVDGISPIPTSRWTAGLFGLKLSWTSVITEYNPGRSMGWKSISGVPTSGRVAFEPIGGKDDDDDCQQCSRMTLTMSIKAPRAIAAIFRRSGALERYFQNKILGGTLRKFRSVVLEEDVQGVGPDKSS